MKRQLNIYNLRQRDFKKTVAGKKKCNQKEKCIHKDELQDLDRFPRATHRPDGRNDTCLDCLKEKSKRSNENKKEAEKAFRELFL
jgi:hypothetical protein